jgi:formate C-acetyltransferase
MDRTVQEVCRKDYNNPFCQRMMERLVFFLCSKVHMISHTVPDYEIVVKEGLDFIRKKVKEKEPQTDLYQAIGMVLEGVMAYANNLSKEAVSLAEIETDPIRKNELITMANACQRVPREKSTTFQEGLQAIWTCHIALHQENNNIALSLGRLDQILYPLYKKDIEEGTLTPELAVELVGCFFLKLADHVPMMPETGEELFGGSGSNQAITLGGVDTAGEDVVNDLTYVMLRATELLKVRDPNVNARYYPEVNPKEYLNRLCEVNIATKATPCFHNDKEVIKTLLAVDYSLEDARNYSIVGCVEPIRGGKTFGHTGAIMLNLTAALEMALFSGRHRLTEEEQFGPKTPLPSEITGFDQFFSIFKEQLIFLIDQSVELNNMFGKTHFKVNPLPLLSALTEGTIDKGKDLLEGGATYNSSGVAIIGLSEVVDSLCAIKEFVFDKKEITFSELMKAIENNWKGQEKLRLAIINSGTKYGTESRQAKEMTDLIINFLQTEYQGRENYRGGRYVVGYWTMTTHAGWGVLTGALPSGRRDKEVLPSGITPVSGRAPQLTETLRFMAELDCRKIANSYALNLKYTPIAGMIDKFAASIEAYMQMGGMQIQFNLIDRATFKDARDHPENYPHLLVRVSGYTAYFADLNPYMQEEIITRAEYDLATGKEKG